MLPNHTSRRVLDMGVRNSHHSNRGLFWFGSQSFHPRLAFIPVAFLRVATDLLHFIWVVLIVNTAQVVLVHVSFGTFIQRASSLKEAQFWSMEMMASGSYGSVYEEILKSGYVVRTIQFPFIIGLLLLAAGLHVPNPLIFPHVQCGKAVRV